ncbi:MAG TPA: O-antigen ligase family protein [Solirubrobacteraceae bacterium]|nr:O-antigen ligase family protein [Solirubrobacteraceae bacterium]
MSAHAVTAEHRTVEISLEPLPEPQPAASRPEKRGTTTLATFAVAGLLCFATFLAGGGLNLAPTTTIELVFTLIAGALVAIVLAFVPAGIRFYGLWSIGLLLAFTALTGLSVVWSVAPDASWQDAGRMLAYSGVFAAAVALAWLAPAGWRALLGGIVLAAVVVCAYALLTKALPNDLSVSREAELIARLQEPYGYWNAIGLTAAMGAIGCLWLGARRAGHALLTALAYPAMGLMIVTLMLAYSRGALAALVVGAIAWMCVVPLRLRGARVLIVGALGAAPVVAWDFSRHALSSEGILLAARTTAGHQLGVLIGAMLLVLALVGIAIGFFGDRRAPSADTRRGAGIALASLLVLVLLAGAGGLAATKRGLTGTISHDLSSLANPNATVPKNTPGRLTAVGSVRARYWKEALEVFKAHPALGAGAAGYGTARLRYRTQNLDVRQAHGYIVQTLADLGIVGLAITLALLIAWMVAAGRSTHPFNRRWHARRSPPSVAWRKEPVAYTPERIGMLAMLCIVIVFGVHSFADWTWYVPGDAFVALLCAGWLAGRGPLLAGRLGVPAGSPAAALPLDALAPDRPTESTAQTTIHLSGESTALPAQDASRLRRPSAPVPVRGRALGPLRIGVAIAVVAGALLAAWTEWQPQRSVEASEQAVALIRQNPQAALRAAQAGVERDSLSAVALFRLSAVEHAIGESALARVTLQKAVQMQPSNPETWLTLGEYDLKNNPRAAVGELRAAVYLNPESIAAQNAYVQALRASPQASTASSQASLTSHAGVALRTSRTGIVHGAAQNRLR